jgi:H+/Cl- antiporter ClcA
MDAEQLASENRASGHPTRIRWRSLSDGLIVSFLITGPSLMAALIVRDQRDSVWRLLLIVAALGLFIGGAIGGRDRRTRAGALWQGAVVGALTSTVILVANVVRILVLAKGISVHTFGLWVGIEVGSVLVASCGAAYGRYRYRRRERRALEVEG